MSGAQHELKLIGWKLTAPNTLEAHGVAVRMTEVAPARLRQLARLPGNDKPTMPTTGKCNRSG